jgi:hypothetical protein
MKKLILSATIGTICTFCLAVNGFSQVKIGPEVGFGWSMLTNKSDGNHPTYVGLHAQFGVGAEVKIADAFAIRPSLLVNTKGCVNADDLYNEGDETIGLTTITMPVTAVWRHEFRNSSNIFLGAGPSIGYSIGGKLKNDGGSESIKFGSSDDKLKPFELGLNGKFGFQFKNNLFMQFYGNIGLNNRSNVTTNGIVFKAHDIWGFGIGYLFGGK